MKYRGRLEIIAAILNAAEKGTIKTRIMYLANLSNVLLEKYLEEMTKTDLINFNSDTYVVTQKGSTFLEKYRQFFTKSTKLSGALEAMEAESAALERMCKPTNDNIRQDKVKKLVVK